MRSHAKHTSRPRTFKASAQADAAGELPVRSSTLAWIIVASDNLAAVSSTMRTMVLSPEHLSSCLRSIIRDLAGAANNNRDRSPARSTSRVLFIDAPPEGSLHRHGIALAAGQLRSVAAGAESESDPEVLLMGRVSTEPEHRRSRASSATIAASRCERLVIAAGPPSYKRRRNKRLRCCNSRRKTYKNSFSLNKAVVYLSALRPDICVECMVMQATFGI